MARRSVLKLYHINDYFMKFDDCHKLVEDEEEFETVFHSSSGKPVSKKKKKSDLHKQFRRGEKAYESNHVKSFVWDGSHLVIKGSVRASMKTQNYTTTVALNEDFSIKETTCTCVRGIACHHIAALLICGHYNISVTDIECTWKAKKSQERNDGLSFDQLYPSKKAFSALEECTEEELLNMHTTISQCGRGGAGIAWILQPEPEPENDSTDDESTDSVSIPNIMSILKSPEFIAASDKFQCLLTLAKLSPTEIHKIASATVGQITNPLWTEGRLFRFNGSKIGDIIHASIKNRKLCESLLKSLFEKVKVKATVVQDVKGGKYKTGVNAAQWGSDHESVAKKKFEEETGLVVRETGLWIHESGLWACSPDGLVGTSAVLEIKCPFQFRNASSLKECLMNEDEFFRCAVSKRYAIFYDEDMDKFVMWDDHSYYHQVQGELWCSFRDICYFVVWIPTDIAIVEVERSDSWYESNLPRLIDKYGKDFLPRLLKHREE
ncbi:Exonuclease [Frankliniella fusca]|uniref:Exonuclease n=1 Tax=Frankliniella fusca TaxID=407009 RepID=A0AAE1LUJ8_9NEOP|nr:Exonuclease [Frankliniella fusca]